MRKVVLGAAVLVAGAVVLAQGDQNRFEVNKIWLSDTTFGELEGFNDLVILNTNPRMILARKQGETMICQMPSQAGGPWPPCWTARD